MISSNKSLLILSLCMVLVLVNSDLAKQKCYHDRDFVWKKDLNAQIYVDDEDYYFYNVFTTKKGDIQVDILNKDLKREHLTFSAYYPLYYRDAYYNFIVVEEKNGDKTVSYWVIEIQECEKGHRLNVFPVNSTYDAEGYNLDNNYLLREIVEYNSKTKILYVRVDSVKVVPDSEGPDSNIFGIDVRNQGSYMSTINWFYFNIKNPERIVGGNSRVLVDATNDQFWIDNRRQKDPHKPSSYDKICIEDLTDLPIYKKGSHAYKLRDTWFQYVSLSSDQRALSTFIYEGYGYEKCPITGEFNVKSSTPFKFFTDEWNYFVAIGDYDVYISVIKYDEHKKVRYPWSTSLKEFIPDKKLQREYIKILSQAIAVIHHNEQMFFLTTTKFYAIGDNKKVYERTLAKALTKYDDIEYVLAKQMKEYYDSCEN